jgi:hypothetical protein
VESAAPADAPSRPPGGAHGAPVDVGMPAVDRETVPNRAADTGQTDYGTSPAKDRQGSGRK